MRITYRMMTSRYSNNLNSLSSDLDKLNTQVATGRKYARTSEDVSSAVRGYQIRRNLSKVEGYQDNIRHAEDFLTNSESTLSQIEASLSEATTKIQQGMNGSQSEGDRKIIASELRTIQKQMLQTMNTEASDMFLFGGTNDQKPFTVETTAGGIEQLKYNGKILDDLTDATAVGKKEVDALKSDALYVDIGLGVTFDEATGDVARNSVFNYSVPGLNFMGYGTTDVAGEKVSNNLYDLLGRVATEFEKEGNDYSFDTVDRLYGLFNDNSIKAYQATTEIGAKSQYLEFMSSRYETQNFNLQERQTQVEGVDAAYTYIAFQSQKVAYSAALQMGQSVVQQSVFDYMN
ncbi:MAG: flagellar hook-associated protein 3 FlgL [Acetobacterium sp.]|nr:flagellar hook-associated protein 3 FlgL [Acetobacterium sp.]